MPNIWCMLQKKLSRICKLRDIQAIYKAVAGRQASGARGNRVLPPAPGACPPAVIILIHVKKRELV